jgi:hypothetical protein
VVCSNCKREGHDSDSCFQLIGYPNWWGNRPRPNATRRGSGRKRNNGGGRDIGNMPRANVMQTLAEERASRDVTDSDRKGLSGLDDEQWSTLLAMLS